MSKHSLQFGEKLAHEFLTMERGNGFTTTVKWGGAMFNNNSNPFGSNNFGNAFGSGPLTRC
jgi:hypothetical protein